LISVEEQRKALRERSGAPLHVNESQERLLYPALTCDCDARVSDLLQYSAWENPRLATWQRDLPMLINRLSPTSAADEHKKPRRSGVFR